MSVISKKTRNQKSFIIEELHNFDLLLDNREVFLHGFMGDTMEDDPGVEYRMANRFVKNMRLLESINYEPIIVHQHSIGGSWECGMMMFDAINNAQSHVICIMHGDACSMGSIVPQAADTRIIMPHCCFMVHDGTTCIGPELTIKQAKSLAKWEEHTQTIMMEIYAHVCINSAYFSQPETSLSSVKRFIRSKIDADEDWFLTASETVHYGFADAVFGSEGHETLKEIKDKVLSE